jgi:ribosomal protein S18 acetylase RimI-like enzyme
MLPYVIVRRHRGYFVDLFVRVSNSVAIGMYEQVRR